MLRVMACGRRARESGQAPRCEHMMILLFGNAARTWSEVGSFLGTAASILFSLSAFVEYLNVSTISGGSTSVFLCAVFETLFVELFQAVAAINLRLQLNRVTTGIDSCMKHLKPTSRE